MLDAPTISRLVPFAFIATAVGALGTAYVSEYGFGYDPCILCLYQRVPYAIAAVLGLAYLFVPAPEKRRLIVFLGGAVFLAGGAIAAYHVGIEQFWWSPITPCTADGGAVSSTQDLFASLQQKPEKSCDAVDLTFLGLSMATYNAAFSIVFAVAAFAAGHKLRELHTQ